MYIFRLIVIFSLATFLYACSTEQLLPDRKVEYKKQRVAESDLEIPPDLTKSTLGDTMPVPGVGSAATYLHYESSQQNKDRNYKSGEVLPAVADIIVKRDGDKRWLEIKAAPHKVWEKMVDFWRENGIILLEQDPTIGVVKTDWLENRAEIKQGFITDFLRKALDSVYSAATRDQFRVRLEPGTTAETTELYLTHRGMEEQLKTSISGDKDGTFWVPRPNDPELEAEMLRRLMLYMGMTEQTASFALSQAKAQQQARSELTKLQNGNVELLVRDELSTAWRLLGIAMERVGFIIEARDKSTNTYTIKYEDPTIKDESGFFSALAFWRDAPQKPNDQYQLRLTAADAVTKVMVLNQQGQSDVSDTATRILTLLQEQIR